jgi:hypothetical protein
MALVLKDRVRETSTTTGTGTIALAGAVTGYQGFTAAIGNTNTCYYTISNPGTTEWEVGIGTVGTNTLARTTILASSNAGSAVDFTAGTKDVFVTYPAEKSVNEDASGNVILTGDLTVDGSTVLGNASGDTLTITGTAVSIPNSLNFDSNTFYIDASNNRVGIGNAAPTVSLTITAIDAMLIPKGATGDRPAGVAGYLRFNTTTSEFEGYNGTAWASVGGSAISNDTSTATDLYPAFLNATTGTATAIYTSNAKLLYKPSTGELKADELVAMNGVVLNNQTMNTSYTMPSWYSGMSTGPFTIAGGVTFTIPSGSRHVVL